MKLYIRKTKQNGEQKYGNYIIPIGGIGHLYADIKNTDIILELGRGKCVYLYGDIFYFIADDGSIKILDAGTKDYLVKVFSQKSLSDVIPRLEGQYIGLLVDKKQGYAGIFSDRYARVDAFYAETEDGFHLATDLDSIFREVRPQYDQKMLAHLFSVYGWYTPKGLTIYKNVRQLKVGEIIGFSSSGMTSEIMPFKPLDIKSYADNELEVYYNVFRDSVISRANRSGKTWVSSSSGWDSSIVLAMLINEFGSDKVGMITGRIKYSEETDVINKFEIDKVNKIGEFYGIKPNIVDFDFKNKTAADYWKKVIPFYRSRHMYSWVTYNFSKLSDALADISEKGQIVFNGEVSDSFHNFGFSQFATFFHTEKTFTEYADKMNCYLYGPSFFKKVMDNSYQRDRVFKIFTKMYEGTKFAGSWGSEKEMLNSYLFPLFYGSPRVPFAETYENFPLTMRGKKEIYGYPFGEYMPDIMSSINGSNLYSWLIYMYHSFHSQGSTTNIHKHGMEMNGHRWRSPFNDYRMIDLLSQAPESWGRGLDLNNTKYPLKWIARNKMKFPYKLLDEGPHSYLYDVIEGFSLAAEVLYRSGVTGLFKDIIRNRPYHNILSDEYFDIAYLDGLVSDYLSGKEATGRDFNNLFTLLNFVNIGWY